MSESHTGAAGGRHSDIAPELRQLAQSILDRLDPAIRFAATRASSGAEGRCRQVWCPVCALAAVVKGEPHPMLSVIAEHSVALLAVVRAVLDAMDTGQGGEPSPPEPPTDPSGPAGPRPDRDPPPPGPGRYQHIPVTVEE